VFNCGSSSLTYKGFAVRGDDIEAVLSGKAHRVGVKGTELSFIEHQFDGDTRRKETPIDDHRQAAGLALDYIAADGIEISAIGHRFVHGGSHFEDSAALTKDTLQKLRLCLPLAPIHNPTSLAVIEECVARFRDLPQYVTFDSAFHSAMPEYAYTYAVPKSVRQEFGFRKYGFHGLSYTYVTQEVARFLQASPEDLRIVACHLGTGGSSVAAIDAGRSIDTSMGYSPLPGLVMSTRCGDIDPMLTLYLMCVYGYRPDDLLDMLNKQSGLLGVSGLSSDIRDLEARMAEDAQGQAELAFEMYAHRLRKYIGSYVALLGGLDVLVFTDDIGVHNWLLRQRVCERLQWAAVILDEDANRTGPVDQTSLLSTADSTARILAVPTEEELVICWEGIRLLDRETDAAT